MYQNGFALSIKKDGEFFREQNSCGERQVYLPFGTEYSIYLKNKTDNRAKFKVKIDGKYAHPDKECYVVLPHSSFDLERFCIDGDMNEGERFKFVNVHGSGEEPGEAKNGLIEVIVMPEKATKPKLRKVKTHFFRSSCESYSSPEVKTGGRLDSLCDGQVFGSSTTLNSTIGAHNTVNYCHLESPQEEGVTVGGSQSYQSFIEVPDFKTSGKITFQLRLKPVKTCAEFTTSYNCYEECKACGGTGLQTDNYGIDHYCPECNGSGQRQVVHVY